MTGCGQFAALIVTMFWIIRMERQGMAFSKCGMAVGDMANRSEDHLLYCPYETASYPQKIVCEGPVPGSSVHLWFDSHASLLAYKKQYCRRKECSQCPIAAVLNKKWGLETT